MLVIALRWSVANHCCRFYGESCRQVGRQVVFLSMKPGWHEGSTGRPVGLIGCFCLISAWWQCCFPVRSRESKSFWTRRRKCFLVGSLWRFNRQPTCENEAMDVEGAATIPWKISVSLWTPWTALSLRFEGEKMKSVSKASGSSGDEHFLGRDRNMGESYLFASSWLTSLNL